ncbi:helix-turn-helix domain-containing protein [Pedobacter sp. MR22-3]|uniref:helix-turn-helix domain-containing protein n=1 Tax=Pedobacter TaxID=84567 RepID=UPI002247AF2D|nr:helix-turn-helix transcriptional regulator [Pedobacter sp. MR22-3]MCX2584648.1 helix-turn-helix transcriptional regulator [Pedobacter sp. MR22-3]
MKQIGENIRNIREAKKISQYAVAYTIGISQAAYSKIERGETEMKASHLYMIAKVLDTSIYDLLPPSLASSMFGTHEYLLAPIVSKVKGLWYWYKAKMRYRKVKNEILNM